MLDRVTSVTVAASATSPARGTNYEHDEAGNITRIVDPLGGVTTQTFDALGRLAPPTGGGTIAGPTDARVRRAVLHGRRLLRLAALRMTGVRTDD